MRSSAGSLDPRCHSWLCVAVFQDPSECCSGGSGHDRSLQAELGKLELWHSNGVLSSHENITAGDRAVVLDWAVQARACEELPRSL